MSEILFISDCHLDSGNAELCQNFINFIHQRACKADALYILGDLFEIWIGDDNKDHGLSEVLDALKEYDGKKYFLPGNRDFLLGNDIALQLSMQIIEEPYIMEINGQNTALLHGDTLCTDDVDYQNFRKMVRTADWKDQFLSKPLPERQSIAKQLRKDSQKAMQSKQNSIMDINQRALETFATEYNVSQIIHGHTHRPAHHQFQIKSNHYHRWVLGDWQPNASYLSYKQEQLTLHDFRLGE